MDNLTIPNKLYGRNLEITALLKSFERISRSHGEVLLVPGQSGVGKTALVQQLRTPVRGKNGLFVEGKFNQYQQNVPYFAFRQVLAELCQELLSGDAQQRTQYRTEILEAVGNLGQLLVDLAPQFETLLGTQPPLDDISPQEARYRFANVLKNFLKVICLPEHPLVLFIDDWQWADVASIELLRQMQVGTELHYILVIVSYRDNEVDSSHPLLSAVGDLRSQTVPVEVIPVEDIGINDVQEFVADTLKPSIDDLEGLAAIIYRKTLGNPFFVRSLLSYLCESNLVWLDITRGCWQWRIGEIDERSMPGSLVELFVLKLRSLDDESRNLLSLAACLGSRFDLKTLSAVSGRSLEECLTLLSSDQATPMLLPPSESKIVLGADNPLISNTRMFLHDRVQQAAYSLIEPAELPSILLGIGRLLLKTLRPEQLADRLFEVVGHLNAGIQLVQDTEEKLKLVELNVAAAHKAYAAIAYRSALEFYRAGSRFLELPGFAELLWSNHHELALQLFKGRAECEFLEGNHAEAEVCVQHAVAHSATALERADALSMAVVHYTLLSRYPEAITTGRQALAELGISLPEVGYEEARDDEIAKVRQVLESRSVASLSELPIMSNPEMLMASKILITMGPPCYRSHQLLWGVIVPKVVNLTLRYGNIPQVGYSHTAFGGLLGWVDSDYATAEEFGELATRLMANTFRSPSDRSVFHLMIGSSIRHWFAHLSYATQDYTDAYEIGLRSSNLQYAAYAFGHNMYCRFYQGVPLASLIQESQRSLEFSRSRLNQWAIDLIEGGLSVFAALSSESPELIGHNIWSEEEYLRGVDDHHNIQVNCIYRVLQTFSCLILGDYDRALALSDEAELLIYTVGTQGLLPWPEHVFARVLVFTSLYSKADEGQKAKWRSELDRMMCRLRIWADNCPDNFEHKYWLASAEMARIEGRSFEAMRLYDKAVECAQAGNFLQWEAMANERACSFWLEYGNERLAHAYWQQAYVCYDRWGAGAKVSSMETSYRTYLAGTLLVGGGYDKSADAQEQDVKDALLEKQITQLRDHARQMQQARRGIEAATQADELVRATEHLRVEIAKRKQVEEEIHRLNDELEHRIVERTAELEASMRELEGFSYAVSHDLRAPLRAVDGYAQILLEDSGSRLDTEGRRLCSVISESGRTMGKLIDNLLAFSRIGRAEMQRSSVDMAALAQSAFLDMTTPEERKRIDFHVGPLPHVLGDPALLRQVWVHLLSNAIKFSSKKERAVIEISGELRGDGNVYSVVDNGVGFDMVYSDKLFRVFHSLHSPGEFEGMGAGLAIVQRIMNRNGGRVWAEGEIGTGATFHLAFAQGE